MQPKFQAIESITALHRGEADADTDADEVTTYPRRQWRPLTLRTPYLAAFIAATAALIAIIQWLLYVSRRDQGVLFAQDINALPLSKSFYYLYLPTIISVVYSFLWTWVDLDIKRLEPYFQLSKPGGATAAGSILLNYPLEFLVTLPFVAFKHRHWFVLLASTVMILIFWGLTPTQAGIFATRTVASTRSVVGSHATAYTPVQQQGNLSAIYAQSVYNIAWLNETLPAFMTKEYILAAFGPTEALVTGLGNVTYTGLTTLYSVDVSCEDAVLWEAGKSYNTSRGCSFYAPPYRPIGNNDTSKPYDTMYVGYQNENGGADYYLSQECNETFSHSFFVRWSKSTPAAIRSSKSASTASLSFGNATSLLCEPAYYQQVVNATIALASQAVIQVHPVLEKAALTPDMFDTKSFEWEMSAAMDLGARLDYPTALLPDQKSHLTDMPLNLAYLPQMAPFAIATNQQPAENYLQPEILRASYEAAYRLLFARRLLETLGRDLDQSTTASGQLSYITEAVVVVPGFAYAATVLLTLIMLLSVALFATVYRRENKLRQDPSTLGTLMVLLSSEASADLDIDKLHGLSAHDVSAALKSQRLCIIDTEASHPFLRHVESDSSLGVQDTGSSGNSPMSEKRQKSPNVRPAEMKLVTGLVFFVLQVVAVTIFAVLYVRARNSKGLPLPSQSTFIRQLVENYIPILFATLIEPFWLVLNRLLSLLQPYDQLRKGNAETARSIDLDYSSLPPQLLFWRAIHARHFVLALVCFMVLLANILAVALSGLMYEGTSTLVTLPTFHASRSLRFVPLNGTGLPFNSQIEGNWQGGTTMDPFYRQMSNLTALTPLPPWTDEQFAYLPLDLTMFNDTSLMSYNSPVFGVSPSCEPLKAESFALRWAQDASNATIEIYITRPDLSIATCHDFRPASSPGLSYVEQAQAGLVALEIAGMLDSNETQADKLFCRQHFLAGWLRYDWQAMGEKTINRLPKLKVASQNSTMLLCKPSLVFGKADIEVDSRGQVQSRSDVSLLPPTANVSNYFTTSPEDLVAQSNLFLTDSGARYTWHNDDYPSDFMNYLIKISTNDSTMLDPSLPPPTPDHATLQLSTMYQKIFAILIGSNMDRLLLPPDPSNTISGKVTLPETRVFFSTPAFVIVESILALYLITTILFYTKRPWRVLPRMPGTVASDLVYLAGSTAFKVLKEEQRTGASLRELQEIRRGWRWGYGTFVGADGQARVGIEREPLVQTSIGRGSPGD